MHVNFHNIEKVKITDHSSEGYIWKKITAFDDRGNKFEIVFFSNKPLTLEIENDAD